MDLYAPFLVDPPARGVEIGSAPDDAAARVASRFTAELLHPLADRHAVLLDTEPLVSLLEQPEEPVDLILDHADADVDAAVFLFETTFARLAPGGVHVVLRALPDVVVMDLMLVSLVRPELVAGVTATSTTVAVHRGPWPSVRESLVFDELRSDPFGIVPR